jgi:hypothetical protein
VCESDDSGWLPFDATQARLEAEYSAGAPSVRTHRGEWTYVIDFSEMVQTNTTTGVRRRVRWLISVILFDDSRSFVSTTIADCLVQFRIKIKRSFDSVLISRFLPLLFCD